MVKMDSSKRAIPVPAEKALKSFYSFLTVVKEDIVGGSVGSRATQDQNARIREKRSKMLEQLKTIAEVLPKYMDLENDRNSREQELVDLVRSSEDDISRDYMAAQNRWVDLLLDKVSDILDSTQFVNLEKLTHLMEKNDAAGLSMEGKDVILFLGSPGSGKTTTMHYLTGTTFREINRDGVSYYKPVDVTNPVMIDMKVNCGGKDVITRHLQVANVKVDGNDVVLCDTPSFGDHETIEEIIANSLGLVRAVQKAKTVRPVLVLSRDEIGFRDQFNAYPQILSILVRMLGTDSNVNLDPFNFVFTKYDTKNLNCLRRQFSFFLADDHDGKRLGKNEANKQAIIQHLLDHTNPDANIIVPTRGNPSEFLRQLMATKSFVQNPEEFFVPNLSDNILSTMKRQLKFTLLDLRDALSKNDNSTGIHRMQQMSKLANLLPEAGIYARHGFKAFKEIINQMVEEDEDEYDEDERDDHSFGSGANELKFTDSKESWNSSESEQWSNLSSKVRKSNSNDLLVSRHLTTVPEEASSDDGDAEKDDSTPNSSDDDSTESSRGGLMAYAEDRGGGGGMDRVPVEDPEESQGVEVEGIHPIEGPSVAYYHNQRETGHSSHSTSFLELAEAHCEKPELHEFDIYSSNSPEKQSDSTPDTPLDAGINSKNAPLNDMNDVFSSDEDEEDVDGVVITSSDDEDEATAISHTQDLLPEEEQAYAEQYSTLLKEMTIKAVEEEDYVLAVQRMQEFMRLAKQSPDNNIGGHSSFKRCVELFLTFSVSLKEGDYHQCLNKLEELLRMGETGSMEAKKCAECGVNAAIKHIVELRDRVVKVTSQLHLIDDPDEFDRASESLRVLRRKVEMSNMLMEACMRGSNERGKSETVLACISYGFKVARLTR